MPRLGLTTRIKKVKVTDGDTIKATFERTMSFRIIGFDAPEIFKPSCEAEKIHGMACKKKVQEIMEDAQEVVAFIPASKSDKIKDILSIGGRPEAHIFVDGTNLAIILEQAGFSKLDYTNISTEEAVSRWGNYKK